jgi:hypothetical protein
MQKTAKLIDKMSSEKIPAKQPEKERLKFKSLFVPLPGIA